MLSFTSLVAFFAIVYMALFQWSYSNNGVDSVKPSERSISLRDVGCERRA